MNFSIRDLKGIGPRKEALFARLHLATVSDLLQYMPRDYEDRSHIWPIGQAPCGTGKAILVCGTVASVQEMRPRRGLFILKVMVSDGTGAAELVWFNQAFKKRQFHVGLTLTAFGKMEWAYGRRQMNTPDTEEGRAGGDGFVPVYGLTDGLRQQDIRKAVRQALDLAREHPDILPGWDGCRQSPFAAMPTLEAYEQMHFPDSMEKREQARRQLAFEELFDMQLGLLLRRRHEGKRQGIKCGPNGHLLKAFYDHLPFTLTKGQTQAFLDIQADMESEVPMQRLVQGDVGSGKTVVAALALAKIVENGYQGALMAPTGILAAQHYEEFCRLFQGLDVHIALLTGRTTAKERQQLLEELAQGHIDILIGTHALIQDDVAFRCLGLVVTDEQHRFGVRQRGLLAEKAANPHLLVMSATPIPRTLGLLMYGDLDISILDELPPGRKPVKTRCITGKKRADLYGFLDREIDSGRQVYIVCPAIEDAGGSGLNAVKSYYEDIAKAYLPDRRVGLMHGKLKPKEKAEVMDDFKSGRLDALVSTTVIEVGVDVPNATVMVIENAERYGLSALHQLRGRVGRGAAESWCFLVSDNASESVQKRLKFLCSTSDGFAVAQYDLETRGPGDFFGSRQHGLPTLQIADLMNDTRTLHAAQSEAVALLAEDPLLERPEHALLARQVEQMFDKAGAMN